MPSLPWKKKKPKQPEPNSTPTIEISTYDANVGFQLANPSFNKNGSSSRNQSPTHFSSSPKASTSDLYGNTGSLQLQLSRSRQNSPYGSISDLNTEDMHFSVDSGTGSLLSEDELRHLEKYQQSTRASTSSAASYNELNGSMNSLLISTKWNSMSQCMQYSRNEFKAKWAAELESESPSAAAAAGRSTDYNLSQFQKQKVIGDGCYGDISLVKFKPNQRQYAMKISNIALARKKGQLIQLLNESRLMACLSFPFIIAHEFKFEDATNIYNVMEYIPSGDLFHHLRAQRNFTEEQTRFYTAQLVLTFEYLHNLGIIYRDLKPENILLGADGYLKLIDFGLAKELPEGKRSYTFCGTPEYIAPEIILCKGYSKAVDWWALGILIYEMYMGQPPFQDENPMKIYEKIISENTRIYYPKSFPPELKDLLKNLIEIDLTKRYGNLRNGVNDIKRHAWFKGVGWEDIFCKKVKAPMRPKKI